jgi:TolB protein
MNRIGLIAIFLCLTVTTVQAQDKLIVDIKNPTAKRISVAVPVLLAGPGVDPAMAQKAAELLRRNLDFSGVFQSVNTAPWEQQALRDTLDEPQYKLWKLSGADAFVRATIQKRGANHVLEFRLYDPLQEKVLPLTGGVIGKQYQIGDDVAPAVHAFSNELMELVTQRQGPFNSRVTFEYKKPGSNRKDLWVINLDGSGLAPLTRNNLLNLAPAWSPDGQLVAYTSYKRRNPDLFLMNVVTGSDEPLSTRQGTNIGASFSADGKFIAASLTYEGNSDIYVLNLKGEIVSKVTNTGSIDVQPAFSPDGKKIAFTSDRVGNPQIYVANRDGTGVQRLTYNGRYNASPAWSPTGEWIAYYSRDDNNIWIIKPDGSASKRLTNGEGINEDPSWSPDGRYVVFSSNRSGTFDIWAADSISGVATRITDQPGEERNPSWGRIFNR